MRPCLRIVLLLAFAAVVPVFGYSDEAPPDEGATNERLLDRWRTDPEHYARLQNDLRAFWQLPPEKQERLRQFDRQLHETDSVTQKRLWGVMERYNAWYDRLPEADRRRLDNTADRRERLEIVKQLLADLWLKRQPQKVRDDIARLPDDKRRAEITKLRREERQRVAAWMRALRPRGEVAGGPAHTVRPVRPSDFGAEGERYINDVLRPQLSGEERDHLKLLEGKWPYYTRMVLELADKHVVKLPGPPKGVARHYDLPDDYKVVLPPPKDWTKAQDKALTAANGKWPDYASAVTEMVRPANPLLKPLGPSRPADFAVPVKQFVETTLQPKLTEREKAELKNAEGKWPEYPAKLLEVANVHRLEVPLMRLPNADDWWEKVRGALPEVPDRVLRDFALNDLTAEERTKLQLSVSDPASRDRLVQEYFKKNPKERKRLEHLDGQMLLNGGKAAKTKPGL